MADPVDRLPTSASPWRDVGLVVLAALAAGVLASAFNLSEWLALSTRGWEGVQLDELPLVLLVLAVGLLVVAERRRRLALRDVQARREAEDRLATALAANRELSHEHLRLQESERRHLARELHDELGQTLNAIKLDAVALRESAGDVSSVQAASRHIVAGIDHAHAAVGGMIGRLRPVALDDLGLVAALEACVGGWQRRLPQLRFTLQVEGDLDDLGEALNVALYRLVQEGLTNAVRHSGSTSVQLRLRRERGIRHGDVIHLHLADAGKGADASGLARGFGLRGMRERAELLGGQFRFRTSPGQGFVLDIELPVGEAT